MAGAPPPPPPPRFVRQRFEALPFTEALHSELLTRPPELRLSEVLRPGVPEEVAPHAAPRAASTSPPASAAALDATPLPAELSMDAQMQLVRAWAEAMTDDVRVHGVLERLRFASTAAWQALLAPNGGPLGGLSAAGRGRLVRHLKSPALAAALDTAR